jgi:BirA family biotin operon repressor/biotin-[acetyl-CoA-carboxylase] ligase
MHALSKKAIEDALDTEWLGRPVIYLPEIGSTNEYLLALATNKAPAGTLVITDYQTAGKGRLDRRWEAPKGTSLLFSLLLRPDWPVAQAHWLTMLSGLAVVAAIEASTGLSCGLKWPNDVMCRVDGAWRKVGGLLLAAGLEADRIGYAVMGIGLNVNIPAGQMPATRTPATSLYLATGREIDRLPLLVQILTRLERQYITAGQGHSPWPDWQARLISIGREVTVHMGIQTLSGTVEGTGPAGQLLLRDATGKLHEISAGDVE